MSTDIDHEPIHIAPWVLVDDLTLDQSATLHQRFAHWLDGSKHEAASGCARARSLGQSDDPETISGWADALTARLWHRAQNGQIQTHDSTIHPH